MSSPAWAKPYNFPIPVVSSDPNFHIPPYDGSLSPPEIIDFYGTHNGSYTYFKWLDEQGQVQSINWRESTRVIHTYARKIAGELSNVTETTSSRPVVAIVANVDTQSYIFTVLSAIRAGFVPFAISINNSPEALDHLFRTSKTQALILGPRGTSPEVDKSLDSALAIFGRKLPSIEIPSLSELRSSAAASDLPPPTLPILSSLDEPHYLLHSSGSTSFPKVIALSHKAIISTFRNFWHTSVPPSSESVSFIGHLPPWHAMGITMAFGYSVSVGSVAAVRAPIVPPPPLQMSTLPSEARKLKTTILVSVPSTFEAWAQSPEAIADLRTFTERCYGGGPLPAEAARKLEAEGAPVQCLLGSTEGLMICEWPCKVPDSVHCRINKAVPVKYRALPDSEETGAYEMLLGVSEHYSPNVLNDTYEGEPVFATNDLVAFHPDDKTLFRVVGRIDDQIMHSSGEKTNPGPMINILKKSPYIQSIVYFGRERPHVGALIEPTPGNEVAENDDKALAAFRNKIASVIDEANAFAPTHSALFKEMVIPAKASKPFERTAKGSVRSGAMLKIYADEIAAAYDAFEQTGITSTTVPTEWSDETSRAYVSAVVAEALETRTVLDQDADLFSNGANSLRATKIRSVLSTALSKSGDAAVRAPPDLVYANPTIRSLAAALLHLLQGGSLGVDDHLKSMEEMLAKYTSEWPAPLVTNGNNGIHGTHHVNGTNGNNGINGTNGHSSEVALVTGTTGGLGAHLLADLVGTPSVRKIFAVNRRSKASSLEDRQRDALKGRGLDPDLSIHDKVVLVEASLEDDNLGVDNATLEALRSETTFIVHNSWRLDFNLSLSSFESHVASTRHLVDLALRSSRSIPPPILFTSSIAVTHGWDGSTRGQVPEEPLPLASSVGGGYGESKAVTEKMLLAATEKTGIKTCSIRIGQMSGSRTNGAWAPTDWLPLIVRAASQLGQLPSFGASPITWLPTDVASKAVLSFRHNPRPVLHIIHPHTVSWDTVMAPLAKQLGVPLVPFPEWVRTLETHAGTGAEEKLPALRLLDFYRNVAAGAGAAESKGVKESASVEAMGTAILSTAEATKLSEDLRDAAPLDADDARKWLGYWKSIGALK